MRQPEQFPHPIIKSALSVEADDAERTMRVVASDETVDSYGDVVSADGWDLTRFKSNPIVLFGHDHKDIIGRASDVRIEAKKLLARIHLADGIERADYVWQLFKQKILRAVSVGFAVNSPDDYEPIYDDDEHVTGYRYLRQELLELSVVAVPANPNALAYARALRIPDEFIRCALPLDASVIQRQRALRRDHMQVVLSGLHIYSPRQADQSTVVQS